MRFKVNFSMDNAAFEGDNFQPELCRILTNILHKFGDGRRGPLALRDTNGNPIGYAAIEKDPHDMELADVQKLD